MLSILIIGGFSRIYSAIGSKWYITIVHTICLATYALKFAQCYQLTLQEAAWIGAMHLSEILNNF